jgi:hypothetical protein
MAGLDSRVAVANIEMELVAMNPPPTQQVKIYFSNPIYVLCNFSELYVANPLNCMFCAEVALRVAAAHERVTLAPLSDQAQSILGIYGNDLCYIYNDLPICCSPVADLVYL